ncbi:MAG: DMT family transporter [Cellvibrionaceae bacterium]
MKLSRAEYVLLIVTIVAASGWLFSKKALGEFQPYSFIALRFSLAAAVLALFCLPQLLSLTRNQVFRAATTGSSLGVTLLFWVIGLQETSSIGESSFIVSLTVIAVPIISWILFSEKIPAILPIALIPALIGLAFLTLDNGFAVETGQLYFLIATAGFALHMNLSSHFASDIPSLASTTIQLIVVGIISGAVAVFLESWPNAGIQSWAWLMASAVIATSFRFTLLNYALKLTTPSHTAMILLLEPIWTAVLGAWLLSEVLSSNKILGCVLIFIALIVFRLPSTLRSAKRYSKP